MKARRSTDTSDHTWRLALAHVALIVPSLLGLFYYWFAMANRSVIFLYGHLGATAFDPRTISRYYMSGLVAAAVVLLLTTISNGLVGRLIATYSPPMWWQTWLISAPLLTSGIYLITTGRNTPALPPRLGIVVALVTLIGLGVALAPIRLAARGPLSLVWLALGGAGIAAVLLLLRAIELPAQGLVKPMPAYGFAALGTVGGALWSLMWGRAYTLTRGRSWSAHQLLVAGAAHAYLIMPLLHHLLFVPTGYRYISVAGNFFAQSTAVQLITFLVAGGVSIGVSELQKTLKTNRRQR